jgi:hypothetical protein
VTQVRVLSGELVNELRLQHPVDIKRICGGSARPPPQTLPEF